MSVQASNGSSAANRRDVPYQSLIKLWLAEKMKELKLANIRVINLLGGAMAINYGEKTA